MLDAQHITEHCTTHTNIPVCAACGITCYECDGYEYNYVTRNWESTKARELVGQFLNSGTFNRNA